MNAEEQAGLDPRRRGNAPAPAALLPPQPIVILGGFLAWDGLYREMGRSLLALAGAPVHIVPVTSADWLPSVTLTGWSRLLHKLDQTVRDAVRASPTGKITLVGHSSGGVIGRLYLSPEPFQGCAYRGLEYVNVLITLGSPHYNYQGGRNRRWVEDNYPGAYYFPDVSYISVAGRALMGDPGGSPLARFAFGVYRRLCGTGETWGDGLVPVASALLEGSHQVTLPGIYHYGVAGRPWYGRPEVIANWWTASIVSAERFE
jgi:pimeloyl-ACP methyl ester carboxylesterase